MKLFFTLLLIASSAFAQIETITRVDAYISNGATGPTGPTGPLAPGGPAITAQAPNAPNGFLLVVTGTGFTSDSVVDWTDNNNPNNRTSFSPSQQPTSTTVMVFVSPASLYSSPTQITLRVRPTDASAAGFPTAPFTVNPRLTQNGATIILPTGTANSPYSQPLFTGGTPPYTIFKEGGATPPGMPTYNSTVVQNNNLFTGVPTTPGTYSFSLVISDPWGDNTFLDYRLQILSGLTITSGPLPNGTVGVSYGANLTATNGSTPYIWSAEGLPPGLSLNPSTGAISGVPTVQGFYYVYVSVTDARNATASAIYAVSIGPPVVITEPLSIATLSPLASGVVGTAYVAPFGASGGKPDYTWSLVSAAPPGLVFIPSGFLQGTPTTPGKFGVTVKVTDSAGQTALKDFSLTIAPAPLLITTASPLPPAPTGAPLNIKFAATGGIAPYIFSVTGSLPPGTSVASNGTLSGTPSTTGTFTFRIAVTDSSGGTQSSGVSTFKDFTITITPPALSITTTSPLTGGQVGTVYSLQLAAIGGVPPYAWTATGVPAGLSVSPSGLLTGTPTANGPFSLAVTVTDSAGAKATSTLALTIIPAALAITTASLPNGVVGAAYSASLAASGGVPPYTWTATGLPDGLAIAANGAITGTPKTAAKFTISATVKDSAGAAATQSYNVTIAPPPLVITTTSIPGATATVAYSTTFAASGGVPPYTWSATGLTGFSISPGGVLTGTPGAPGTPSFTVTVTDSAGASTSRTLQLTIALPPPPPITFTGLSDTSNPGTQPRLQITFGTAFPVDVTVVLTLTFKPDSGADDPNVQFSSGGRTARITVPAGSTVGQTDVGIQTGTVAGTITITAQLLAPAQQDITPSPAPSRTVRVSATAPVITSVTATRNGTGFTVVIVGYASTRDLTQATFQFTATAGSNLQTSSLTIPIDTIFTPWYSSAASAPFGSQFTLTQPFTVQGSAQSITSVTVTLTSKAGTSAAASANLQ